MSLNKKVRGYWENEVCGTYPHVVGTAPEKSPEWYRSVEDFRYDVEPFIHSWAQFTRHNGKKMLEIGVGAGTDHLQWARAGLDCHGVDLTDAAIATAGGHLALHGFESKLQRVDAETLPFEDGTFDIVYSWGVIHHSEKPEAILKEIRRVLKPGGEFIGMLYARHSVLAVKLWIKHALLRLQPWRSLGNVIWNHVESIGTKSYTPSELKAMFGGYREFRSQSYLTVSDTSWIPRFIHRHFPQDWGFYIAIKAKK